MSERPPLQNRVDPWGRLRRERTRGSLMGNRGILHVGQEIVRPWATKAWVTCVLDEKFQKRKPFSPGTYSELFFLDEATAFAAGHRPCRVCQRQRHDHFNTAWTAANASVAAGTRLPIADIDKALHGERTEPGKGKRTYTVALADLPLGAFFEHAGQARLVWSTGLLVWSFTGYTPGAPLAADAQVEVLTPRSIVQSFRGGFRPCVHKTANAPDLCH
ncbi:hypothetical protein [Roseateles sp.]|uniref:hypothetical protein n=1 Tax=Roseateles sp. TaxID=1971397 RepID=UPI00393A1D4E